MTLYSIFEKPAVKGPAESPLAVPERFSWFAALLPPLFALRHGLWLVLVVWVALLAILIVLAPIIGEDTAFWAYVLAALFIGLEAPAMRRDALESRGWEWRGDLIAAGEDLAQRDYLSTH